MSSEQSMCEMASRGARPVVAAQVGRQGDQTP